ncbi:MAG TPA: phosphate ABC transporter permease PstA [Euryarchaeota archaeon]|nr:phosphate ABC transporter permease PstA [Euryarchaeota archaeon]
MAVLIIFLIIIFILYNSWDAITEIGILEFLTNTEWMPSSGEYGAVPLILGTLLVTLGAMVFAIPIGVGSAIYISEIAPSKFRNTIKPICELFAGIPSVVYGFFGLVFMIPILRDMFPDQLLFGSSWLAGSLVLGIMALPTVISVSEDAIHAVPQSYREASLAMGATKWETTVKVVLPAAMSGVSAAIILGIGRAVGETMAVMMVTGNNPVIPDPLWNIFSVISTLTGTIGLQVNEASGVTLSALFFLGIILMVLSLIINMGARSVVKRSTRKLGNYDHTKSLTYKITGRDSLIPENLGGMISDRKELIMATGAYVLLFVCVWMMSTLFTGDGISVIIAAVITVVVFALHRVWKSLDSTLVQSIAHGAMTAIMGLVILILVVIIAYILINGLPALSWDLITDEDGVYPAIIGTLELMAGTAIIAFPLGILTGVYLSEYAKDTHATRIIREAIDLLNGTPSVVFGLFGLVFLVRFMDFGVSLLAGWITLAFMILPVIIRTTEEAIDAVPHDLREASRAMGASKWKTTYKVVLPAAMGGVVTGSILAIGRAAGETAPIMFTAAIIFQPTLANDIFDSVMALPLHLYHLAMDVPGSTDEQFATAIILLIIVFAVFGLASLVRSHYNKKVKW